MEGSCFYRFTTFYHMTFAVGNITPWLESCTPATTFCRAFEPKLRTNSSRNFKSWFRQIPEDSWQSSGSLDVQWHERVPTAMIHQCARFKLEACINLRQVTGWFLIVIFFFIQASFDAPTQLQARPYLSPPRCDKVLKNILIPQYWSATIGSAGWMCGSQSVQNLHPKKIFIISLVHCICFDGWMWFDDESQFGWASYPSAASWSASLTARFFPKAPGCRARPRVCCVRSWRPWWRLHGAITWPSPSHEENHSFYGLDSNHPQILGLWHWVSQVSLFSDVVF